MPEQLSAVSWNMGRKTALLSSGILQSCGWEQATVQVFWVSVASVWELGTMVKEALCLFEERIHAVPLCRKSKYDKKYTSGTAAVLWTLRQKGSVTNGSRRCYLNAIIVALTALPCSSSLCVSYSDDEEGFGGLCSKCSVWIDAYPSPPAKQVSILYLELYKWFSGNN